MLFKRKSKNINTKKYAHEAINVLELGSSKFLCAQAIHHEQRLNILGVGQHACRGYRDNNITDVALMEESVLRAIESCEDQSGSLIKSVYVGIGGTSVHSHMMRVTIPLNTPPIEDSHIEQLYEKLQKKLSHSDIEYFYINPLCYSVDQSPEVLDPRGMFGRYLTMNVLTAGIDRYLMDNLMNIMDRTHVQVNQVLPNGYASAIGNLVEDEIELGVIHIDIGGRSTQVCSFMGGILKSAFSIPIGGDHITHDIAKGLGISIAEAERLKTIYGSSIMEKGDDRRMFSIAKMHQAQVEKRISKLYLTNIIRPRVEELFEMIMGKIQLSSLVQGHKYVITGGGALLSGIKEKAESMLKGFVRTGTPLNIINRVHSHIAGPDFSACAGLLSLVAKEKKLLVYPQEKTKKHMWDYIRSWIHEKI